MKRRQSLFLGSSLLGGSLLGYAGLIEPLKLRLREETIYLKALPAAFEGFKIAHLTDFHYRPFLDKSLIEKCVAETMQWKPDLIALTGDFIEKSPEALAPLLALLAPLKAPHGVYGVLGNHDHYGLSVRELVSAFSGKNIQLLVNQTVDSPFRDHSVKVVGIDSAYASTPQFNLHVPQHEREFRLLLVHEPDVFPQVTTAYAPHLQLSGHTHGGQVRLPFINKPLFTPPYGRLFIDGQYEREQSSLFVSSGIGTSGLRLRFCCPPEIALLTLRSHPSSPIGAEE